jgi:hypothetical protein
MTASAAKDPNMVADFMIEFLSFGLCLTVSCQNNGAIAASAAGFTFLDIVRGHQDLIAAHRFAGRFPLSTQMQSLWPPTLRASERCMTAN